MGEVDQFLDEVEAELARCTRRTTTCAASSPRLSRAAPPVAGPGAAEGPRARQARARAGPAARGARRGTGARRSRSTTVADASSAAARLLEIATRNADELVGEAKDKADKIVGEARTKAERLESEAQGQGRPARVRRPHPLADARRRDRRASPAAVRRPREGARQAQRRGGEPALLRARVPQPAARATSSSSCRRSTAPARPAASARRTTAPKRLKSLLGDEGVRTPSTADSAPAQSRARRDAIARPRCPLASHRSRSLRATGAVLPIGLAATGEPEAEVRVGTLRGRTSVPAVDRRVDRRSSPHLGRPAPRLRPARACSRIASAVSPSACQRSAIRSLTSKPLFLRASWTSRTTSRASPARTSSGVSSQVERDRLALLVDDRPALPRPLGDDHLVGQHLDVLAVDGDHRRPSACQGAGPARPRRRRRSPPPPAGSACRTACRGRGSCPSRCGRRGRHRRTTAARARPR